MNYVTIPIKCFVIVDNDSRSRFEIVGSDEVDKVLNEMRDKGIDVELYAEVDA